MKVKGVNPKGPTPTPQVTPITHKVKSRIYITIFGGIRIGKSR